MLAGVGVSAVSTHETEIYAGERTGDTSREEHPSATPRHFSAEDKIRIVLEGLRGDDSIAELCRREGIAQNLYYRWSKDFLEVGKKRLAGDTARAQQRILTARVPRDRRSLRARSGRHMKLGYPTLRSA